MDVVRNFLARYEQTREEEMSLEDYLDLCKRDPLVYATAAERQNGRAQGINSPAELPRIAAVVAGLRSLPLAELAQATTDSAVQALPRLAGLLPPSAA